MMLEVRMDSKGPFLRIDHLTTAYRQGDVWYEALREVSLSIDAGQSYGLVGESGSGKTTLGLAVLGYLGKTGKSISGKVILNGQDLLDGDEEAYRHVWGRQIGFVPQNPLTALNPSMRVGEQLTEALVYHHGLSQKSADEQAKKLLNLVRLSDADRILRNFPHQISGGMQQRVLIAMALSLSPGLLLLDEPTTNLDLTTQASILDLLRDLITETQVTVLYITHNLSVVSRFCDRVAVLYAGEIVEDASLVDLYTRPLHPYTLGLLKSIPTLGEHKNRAPLSAIPGAIPALGQRPFGCVFAPRCPIRISICDRRPGLETLPGNRKVRCHRWKEIQSGEIQVDFFPSDGMLADQSALPSSQSFGREDSSQEVLQLNQISVAYDLGRSLRELLSRKPKKSLRAIAGVSLSISRAATIGLVGESGSGKTTLARTITGLIESSQGEMELFHKPLPSHVSGRDLETLKHIQMVFQNPDEALNPYMTVAETLRRPFQVLLKKNAHQADQEVYRLLTMMQLDAVYADRYPSQLSGGEKQRVAIARAFATNPSLLIADEPVSALDVSVQAAILNLLVALQKEFSTALLLISHDLAVVCYLADLIAVIYLGQLVEIAKTKDILSPPYHPYTEVLLSASLSPDPLIIQQHIRLDGEIPSPVMRPTGCAFHTRCPRSLGEKCRKLSPPWQTDTDGKSIYCHIPVEELKATQSRVVTTSGQAL